MKREETRQYFQKHCTAQRKSGLTVVSYCDKHGIKTAQFYYWKKQLRSTNREMSKNVFQKVSIPSSETTFHESGVSILLPNGIILKHHNTVLTLSELSALVQELRRGDV